MRGLPLAIPIFLTAFVSLGLARIKTIGVVSLFSILFVYGYNLGSKKGGKLKLNPIKEEVWWGYIGLILSLLAIVANLVKVGDIPVFHSYLRTSLNPKLTALTYLFGVPSSVYLVLKGKKIGFSFPFLVALYGYRTPILTSAIALALPYLYEMKEGTIKKGLLVGVIGGIVALLLSILRGSTEFLVRIQGTTSVLDVIVKRCSLVGFYHGELQFSGITSYLTGGLGPRMLISRYLGVSGVTTTATLIGGMYLDFGILSGIEMFFLGMYYGAMENLKSNVGRALYYSTLAYGIVGVETGILDLPVYLMFILALIVFWRESHAKA